jgi:drug/metabolite transporter (DMT)-like permease
MHKPVWWWGIGFMVIGLVLGGVALGYADVTLVEPLLALNVLFALVFSRRLFCVPTGPLEWLGAAVLVVGVAAFETAGHPRGGDPGAGPWTRWLAVFVLGGVVALLIGAAIHRHINDAWHQKAMLLGAAAGLSYGLQDGVTRYTVHIVQHGGIGTLMASWPPYALLGLGTLSVLLAQSAFEAAPLRMSLPAITAAEPVAGIIVGLLVFDERLRFGPISTVVWVLGLVLMVIGVLSIARSPVLDAAGVRRR